MKIGLIGYFGYGNIGDEAILKYELRDLQEHLPYTNFTIITNQCTQLEDNQCIPLDIDSIIREDFDLILWGGGWILYDIADNQKAFKREVEFIDKLKRKFTNQIGIYGTSVGPIEFKDSISIAMKTQINRNIDFAIIRDNQSISYLKKIGFKDSQIHLGSDFGYEVNPILDSSIILPNQFIALSLSNYLVKDGANLSDLITFCDQLPIKVLLLPAQYLDQSSNDLKFANQLNKKIRNSLVLGKIKRSPENIAGILSKANFVITNRLHIAILASVSGVPTIGINSPKKLDFFYKDINQPKLVLKPSQLTTNTLNKLSNIVTSNRGTLVKEIQTAVLTKRQQSLTNVQKLINILD